MGNTPVRRLKLGVIPSVNVPNYLSTETSSALKRKIRMETKLLKQVRIVIICKNK